jgi:hypothetical protein
MVARSPDFEFHEDVELPENSIIAPASLVPDLKSSAPRTSIVAHDDPSDGTVLMSSDLYHKFLLWLESTSP